MDYIEDSTLSAIIMRNTTISQMQADAFHIAEPGVLALIAIGLAGLRQRRRLPELRKSIEDINALDRSGFSGDSINGTEL
jgi:hypothetical protein